MLTARSSNQRPWLGPVDAQPHFSSASERPSLSKTPGATGMVTLETRASRLLGVGRLLPRRGRDFFWQWRVEAEACVRDRLASPEMSSGTHWGPPKLALPRTASSPSSPGQASWLLQPMTQLCHRVTSGRHSLRSSCGCQRS